MEKDLYLIHDEFADFTVLTTFEDVSYEGVSEFWDFNEEEYAEIYKLMDELNNGEYDICGDVVDYGQLLIYKIHAKCAWERKDFHKIQSIYQCAYWESTEFVTGPKKIAIAMPHPIEVLMTKIILPNKILYVKKAGPNFSDLEVPQSEVLERFSNGKGQWTQVHFHDGDNRHYCLHRVDYLMKPKENTEENIEENKE